MLAKIENCRKIDEKVGNSVKMQPKNLESLDFLPFSRAPRIARAVQFGAAGSIKTRVSRIFGSAGAMLENLNFLVAFSSIFQLFRRFFCNFPLWGSARPHFMPVPQVCKLNLCLCGSCSLVYEQGFNHTPAAIGYASTQQVQRATRRKGQQAFA